MRRALAPSARLALAAGLSLAAPAGCSRPFVSPIVAAALPRPDPAAYDATWRALIRALACENVPLRAVAKDSGVLASDEILSPIGVYADCGRLGDVGLEGEATVTFTVFVQARAGQRYRRAGQCQDAHTALAARRFRQVHAGAASIPASPPGAGKRT